MAVHDDRANQFVIFQHWNRHMGPYAPKFDGSNENGIAFQVTLFRRKIPT